MIPAVIAVIASFLVAIARTHRTTQSPAKCRCFPGDTCWPSVEDWNELNRTVGGRLVPTIPLAAPCHDDQFAAYNNATCAYLRDIWFLPEAHYGSSSSVMAPFFANQSCDPFLPRSAQCVIGTYVQYAINVTCAEDIKAGLRFAHKKNIRLVIRNTGHDYNGKSTGAGALGLWMHSLKTIDIKGWSDPYYTGKAIKLGAGVQGIEAYRAADAAGLQIVGGECPTVGIAGGYTQGGGHSALASRHGLAADQALEWEVVTGIGEHLIANRHQNTDLYWALSGGGGGTYGVVLSLTSKAHPDTPTSGANLTFSSTGISQDDYYDAISTFHASLPSIVDAGAMSVWAFSNESCSIGPVTGPNVTIDHMKSLLAPLIRVLDDKSIAYTKYFDQFPGYLQEYTAMQWPINVSTAQYGGRLIPRSVVLDNNSALTEAYRFINNQGGQVIGVAVNVNKTVAGNPDNAVLPGWRENLIDTVIVTPWNFSAPWNEMLANQDLMTNVLIPKLAELTPNGSCYLNEGDPQQPDFQSVFYGSNYDRLNEIKDKYDPHHIFYAITAVGSEYWTPQPDGRLCRANE